MASSSLFVKRQGQLFPGWAPAFNPKHLCARKTVGSAVSIGAQFINLLSGKTGTLPHATNPTGTVSGYIGPASFFTLAQGTNSVVDFTTANDSSPFPTTFGAIFIINSLQNNPQGIVQNGTSSGNKLQMALDGNTFRLKRWNATDDDTTFGPSINVPYFLAVSSDNTNVTNFVWTRLDTGFIQSKTMAPGSTATAGTAQFSIGPIEASGNGSDIKIAAAMYSQTLNSMASMLAWAADPWSFWYPQLPVNIGSVIAAAAANFGWLSVDTNVLPRRRPLLDAYPAPLSPPPFAGPAGIPWAPFDEAPPKKRIVLDQPAPVPLVPTAAAAAPPNGWMSPQDDLPRRKLFDQAGPAVPPAAPPPPSGWFGYADIPLKRRTLLEGGSNFVFGPAWTLPFAFAYSFTDALPKRPILLQEIDGIPPVPPSLPNGWLGYADPPPLRRRLLTDTAMVPQLPSTVAAVAGMAWAGVPPESVVSHPQTWKLTDQPGWPPQFVQQVFPTNLAVYKASPFSAFDIFGGNQQD